MIQGKASGSKLALRARAKLQSYLYNLGCSIQKHAGKFLFVGLLMLITFCVGLKSVTMEINVERLWVEEGGRLEKEMKYIRNTLGEDFGSTNQIVIQTPKVSGANVLHPNAMLTHLQAMRVATQATVEMFEVTWRLKDICYSPSIPSFDTHYIDSMLENLFPCAIITPLDCFWEGAKLLGPEFPVSIPGVGLSVQWTNLNPEFLVQAMSNLRPDNQGNNIFPFATLQEFMRRAGITTAYQKKPCLNASDENCPSTAPNKLSGQPPDIGAELTGGCYGFATKYMHWPPDLIVGGIKRNKTGYIVKAKALQSIIQLMGEQEMYDFYQNTYKVHNLDWSVEKARIILEAWQRKFLEEMRNFAQKSSNEKYTRHHDIHIFTSTSLMDIMKNFSDVNGTKVVLGYLLMLVYASLSLARHDDHVNSLSFLGFTGVLLIALAVTAALGCCALIGLPFNASTTQILPFLALGLGVDGMFLLAHTYSENMKSNIAVEEMSGETLRQIGCSILLSSLCNVCAFVAAAIIPIPALRAFVLQSAILVVFTSVSLLVLFPAIVSIDVKRRRARRKDLLCCFSASDEEATSLDGHQVMCDNNANCTSATQHFLKPSHKRHLHHAGGRSKCIVHHSSLAADRCLKVSSGSLQTQVSQDKFVIEPFLPGKTHKIASSTCKYVESVTSGVVNGELACDTADDVEKAMIDASTPFVEGATEPDGWTLTCFAVNVYYPVIEKRPVKVCIILLFIVILVTGIIGISHVKDGLDLTDIVPRNTIEYKFLSVQKEYFSFFNMFAVTQGNFEYPTNQRLLHEYHHSFTRIGQIIKNDDGGLPDFWLTMFRDWLVALQHAFDRDFASGCITRENWFPNASDSGILAYKLLVQTGRVDNPVDKSLVTSVRLVDSAGIINPKAFYNYLTAWVSNDALAYSASQANFRPEPRHWIHDAKDVELKIPKSPALIYAQMPFYLNKMSTTEEIMETIQAVRGVCQKFEDKGVPNFPTGIPFIFWEQYVRLRLYLFSALVLVLAVVFLVIFAFLLNPLTATLIVTILAAIVLQLFGLMGFINVRLSAVPAVILIVAVGISINFVCHITLSFLSSPGDRNSRMRSALQHMFAPVLHGIISTFLGVSMLFFSEFDFIIRYFFYVLLGLIALGAFNGLVLLPVLLSILGPPSEIIPFEAYKERLAATPSPPLSPQIIKKRLRSTAAPYFPPKTCHRTKSNISLSTISEETHSHNSSPEAAPSPQVVQPELIVETTTYISIMPKKS